MSANWNTIRIFISSTFRDMHAERDHLVRVVFPELRERCARLRLHLVDVDLRWGVTEEEAEQGRVLELCLDEIERCRPFFIGLLGSRYGWVPPRYSVPDERRYDWVRGVAPGHSVTAMEIYHGVLRDPTMATRAFFYFRDPAFLATVPAAHQALFLPESDDAAARLAQLKADIAQRCRVFDRYPCAYAGLDAAGRVQLTGLEAFGARVLEDLWTAIVAQHPPREAPHDELATERGYHETFVEARASRFVGRRDLLTGLNGLADGVGNRPVVVVGTPGCGKSALAATFARDWGAAHPDAFVLPHFIGVSPGSSDIRRTLLRLCREIARRFQFVLPVPEDYHELRRAFPRFLALAAERARTLIIIDGLNQLDESHHAHALDWLPSTLPPGLAIVVTTLAGDCLDALRRRDPPCPEMTVPPLADHERREIVRQTLGAYRKRLDERADHDQMALLLRKAEADHPLYLIVACEELRVFGEFERVTDRIAGMRDEMAGLFEQVLARLEDDHGEALVRQSLALLASARHGLLESEMLDLLKRPGEAQLPRAVFARLYRSLQFYLRPPGESDCLDFFHRQLAQAVRRRYLTEEGAVAAAHRALSACFWRAADPAGARTWTGADPRGFSELAYHLLGGEQYEDLFRLASDDAFAAAQARAFPGDPHVRVAVLQAAIEGAARIDAAERVAAFVLRHADRLVEINRDSPLDAARDGRVEQAWNTADLFPGDAGILWHLLLAWEFEDAGHREDARETLRRLNGRDLPAMSSWRGEVAAYLLAQVSEVDPDAFATLWSALLSHSGTAFDVPDPMQRNHLLSMCRHLAAAGRPAAGLPVAASLNGGMEGVLLATLGAALGRRGDAVAARAAFARAYELAAALSGMLVRDRALAELGQAQGDGRDFDGARQTMERIELGDSRTGPFCHVAAALSAEGRRDAAQAAFRQALDMASIRDPRYREEDMARIAMAMAGAGDPRKARVVIAEAFALLKTIKQDWGKAGAFALLAVAQARAGDYPRAFRTVRWIRDVHAPGAEKGARRIDQARALIGIARAQADAGKRRAASITLARACRLAARISDQGTKREEHLAAIAAGQAALGREAAAFATARLIEEEGWHRVAILGVAIAQADGHAAQAARATIAGLIEDARAVEAGRSRVTALAAAAAAMGRSGDREQARGLLARARALAAPLDRQPDLSSEYDDDASPMYHIALAQAECGDFEAARTSVRAIRRSWTRGRAAEEIALAMARAGDSAGAIQWAKTMDREVGQTYAIERIVRLHASAGRLADAESTLRSAGESWLTNARIQSALAAGYAAAGDVDAARQCADRISGPGSFDLQARVSCLAAIAAALARAGRAGEAEAAFADAVAGAAAIQTARDRGAAERDVATMRAGLGQFDAAFEAARAIADVESRVEALGQVAAAWREHGDEAGARAAFDAAFEAAGTVRGHIQQAQSFKGLASTQARCGDIEAARRTFAAAVGAIRTGMSGWSQPGHHAALAVAQAEAGFGEDAAETADAILTDRHRHLVRTSVAVAKQPGARGLKGLLVPCSHYVDSAYRMCGLLAQAYPREALAVADLITARQIDVSPRGARRAPGPARRPWWRRLIAFGN